MGDIDVSKRKLEALCMICSESSNKRTKEYLLTFRVLILN